MTTFTLNHYVRFWAILGILLPIGLLGQAPHTVESSGEVSTDFPYPGTLFDVTLIGLTPKGAFSYNVASVCQNLIQFTDLSTSNPEAWRWDFGDGGTDTVQHPIHAYTSTGTYAVKLIVSNAQGADTIVQTVRARLPQGPVVLDQEICQGTFALISLVGTNEYTWYDGEKVEAGTGNLFATGVLDKDTTIFIQQTIPGDIQKIGPPDATIGQGFYLDVPLPISFTVEDKVTIRSMWIDAQNAGSLTFYVWKGFGGIGNPFLSQTVNVVQGPQRVTLDIEIPTKGDYSIATDAFSLYINVSGGAYPYEIPGFMTILSPSNGFPDAYFYYYDWEVEGPRCDGDILPVNIKTIDANFTHVADTATQTVSFTDVSTNATSWAWDFGDGSTSTLSDPVHTYAGAGTYPVELRVNKICTYRDTVVLPVVSSLDASVGMPQISLSPNPAQHQIYVRLDRPTQENLELLLFTLDGKILRESSILKGEAQKEFDLGGISTGVYRMQIRGASMIQTLPVMIHP